MKKLTKSSAKKFLLKADVELYNVEVDGVPLFRRR